MNPSLPLRAIIGSVALCLYSLASNAAEDDHRGVGLVLSGGGARGIAHIGVLKALEELRVPVSRITGTSIGSVVGSLYASGMSPEEIERFFRQIDWHFVMSDTAPRETEPFREKQRDFSAHQDIAFNVSRKNGVSLPAGLIRGRNLIANLRQLTIPVRHITDFDKLPIPFRAIATDFETGSRVVLRKGDLVQSVRASMSVPAAFTPVKIDGHLLADGGMVENLPIETMQEMGAGPIVAVDVTEPMKKSTELVSAVDMANQVLNVFNQQQTRAQIARLAPGDVYIFLPVQDVGSLEFKKAAASIQLGYEFAMKKRAELARYSVSPEEFARFLGSQRRPRPDHVMITYLHVVTPTGEYEHKLSQPIELVTKDPVQFAKLQGRIGDLGEMQKYDVGDYELIDEDGRYGLRVKARKKAVPTYLNFGFDFGYSSTDEADFNLLFFYRMTELNSLGAQWNTYLRLGTSTRVESEWIQPVDPDRRFFLATHLRFDNDFINGVDGSGNRLRFRLQECEVGFDAGIRLWQIGEFRAGYARGVSKISRRLGVPEDEPGSSAVGYVHAGLTLDALDSANFPTRGYLARAAVISSHEELGADDNYTRLEAQAYKPITIGKNTIVPRVSVSIKLDGDDIPLYNHSSLGGFLNLSGLSRGGLFDESVALAELIYYRKIAELSPALGRGVYAGFSAEAGEAWGGSRDFSADDAIFAGSVFIGADTVAGSLHLGFGYSEGGNTAVYLLLGPVLQPFPQKR
jgi:NTE family protein